MSTRDLELTAIGTLIVSGANPPPAIDRIRPGLFADEALRAISEAVVSTYVASGVVDHFAILSAARAAGWCESLPDLDELLLEATDAAGLSVAFEGYVELLEAAAERRGLLRLARNIERQALDAETAPREARDDAARALMELDGHGRAGGPIDPADALAQFEKRAA
ncbi:MAG: hypothetical protein AAF517_04545, partial [Planctomycetota bacterium]